VAWTDVANETRYNVERTSPTGVVSIVNLAANVISYRHTGLVAGDIWRYRVRASNATGTSAWSAQVSTTPDGPPVAPTLATATLTSPSTVSIGWRDNASNEVAFEIGRQTLNPVNRRWGATQVVATAAALPGLGTTGTVSYAPGAAGTYRFQVRATNTRGNSAWSAVTAQVVVTP
jgi:titin